ncbi:MAG: diacylglycerol kinase family lipid kinase [Bacteroidales bacterium]|nr:diacylglycerol kinase family lipid kinase [Bacteroidales bacterium]
MNNDLFFIVNPNSGNDKGRIWKEIFSYLDEKGIKYSHYLTKAAGDAIENIPRILAEGYRNLIVLGGDGTTNEVVNGIFSQTTVPYSEICLGSISMGTANDWNRYYGWENDYKASIERLLKHNITKQDVGVVTFCENGEKRTKYFINSIGFGFDAEIVKMTNSLSHEQRGKEITYLLSLLKCLLKCKKHNVTIESDDFKFKGKVLSISIANGKFSGGGMQQTPDAIINDGAYDISIFGDIGKFFVIRNVSRLYNGSVTQIKNKNVVFARTENSIKVTYDCPTFAETDGEIIGDSPFEISMIKGGLNVID